jgi:plasmid maintenance system antidote protein VapI
VEVVDASIPFLLGLDFMDRIGVTPNTLTNRLEIKHGRIMHLVRHDDHIFLE